MKHEHPSLTSSGPEEPVLHSVSAHGQVEGLLLSMTLQQTFRNHSDDHMEVVYTFPLAFGSVLLGMEATLGGKHMTAQVMARTEARERYEVGVEKGDLPVMLEKIQGGVFSASLGSLKPGEEATIELTYAQLLAFEQGHIRIVVPTTIAPRYGDALAQGKFSPDQVIDPSLASEHRFDLAVTLCGAVARARIGSPTHRLVQRRVADNIKVELQGLAWLDRDFVLLLEDLEGSSFAIAGPDLCSGPSHAALIASYCPEGGTQQPSALRLKILVDCSGSMAGDSITNARDALRHLAGSLKPEDLVSFSRFGSQPQRVLDFVAGTPDHVHALLNAIDGTEAQLGGTEMAHALEDTFCLHTDAAGPAEEADVLLITDGEVWDAGRIVDDARRSGHRIHALGVGSAPAESLLREMAEATGGACEFATPGESMAAAIRRLLARIRLALPVEARLELPTETLWCSPIPRRFVAGETVHLFMRLPTLPARAPLLHIVGQEAIEAELMVRNDDLVARLVAAREIGQMSDRSIAARMAERYRLVTEETNLLLIIERADAEKTDGMPTLHQVRSMLAAGWGGTGSVVQESSTVDFCFERSSRWVGPRSRSYGSEASFELNQVPAFLRRTGSDSSSKAESPLRKNIANRLFTKRSRSDSHATSDELVAAFNDAAVRGQGFRKTLRAVTALSLDRHLDKLMVEVGRQVGGKVKAWACYLLWLHDSNQPGLQLSQEAYALVVEEVRSVPSAAFASANVMFNDQLAKA